MHNSICLLTDFKDNFKLFKIYIIGYSQNFKLTQKNVLINNYI